MKNCREVEALMAPYVDGSVPPEERSSVDEHLHRCPACRDDIAAQAAIRDALHARRTELRGCATSALKERCAGHASVINQNAFTPRQKLRHAPAASGVGRRIARRAPLAAAATIVLAVAGVFGLGLNNKVQALAVQMTLDHMKCSRFNSSPVAASASAAAQYWAVKFGWSLTVPPTSQKAGLELRAVRRCGVTDGRVAHLMYQWRGEPLSLYVLPSKAIERDARVERFGHDSVMWTQNGRTYVVLAAASRKSELADVVQYMRANAH